MKTEQELRREIAAVRHREHLAGTAIADAALALDVNNLDLAALDRAHEQLAQCSDERILLERELEKILDRERRPCV